MKKEFFFLLILAVGNVAFSQVGTGLTRGGISGSVNYKTHPFRQCNGRIYNFSEAIKWKETAPPLTCPYPSDNPMARDWAARMQKYKTDGRKWNACLVGAKFLENGSFELGTVMEQRPEGWVISMPVTKTHDEIVGSSRQGRYMNPVYQTVTEHTTRQILLKNAPGRPMLPVFGIALGYTSLASGASLETFDYGMPLDSLPKVTPVPVSGAVAVTTNAPATQRKSSTDANLLKYYQDLANKGDAYGQFRMGERYLSGNGVPKDEAKAKDFFTKAAAQGNTDAEAALLRMRNAESP